MALRDTVRGPDVERAILDARRKVDADTRAGGSEVSARLGTTPVRVLHKLNREIRGWRAVRIRPVNGTLVGYPQEVSSTSTYLELVLGGEADVDLVVY